VNEQSQAIADYITTKILRNSKITLAEDTPLVSSGLIDSLALVDLLAKLEQVMNVRIPVGKVQPKDLDSIGQMLSTAQRVGMPRQ
jgi:acyl carrier protein